MKKDNYQILLTIMIPIFSGFIFGFYKIGLDDHWWHLANGKAFFETGSFPTTDIFSFTHYGKPVNNWEWLWDYGTYLIWQKFGAIGIIIFRVFLISSLFSFFILFIDSFAEFKKEKNFNYYFFLFLIFVFSALLIHPRLSDRPHLAGYLFMIIIVSLI